MPQSLEKKIWRVLVEPILPLLMQEIWERQKWRVVAESIHEDPIYVCKNWGDRNGEWLVESSYTCQKPGKGTIGECVSSSKQIQEILERQGWEVLMHVQEILERQKSRTCQNPSYTCKKRSWKVAVGRGGCL